MFSRDKEKAKNYMKRKLFTYIEKPKTNEEKVIEVITGNPLTVGEIADITGLEYDQVYYVARKKIGAREERTVKDGKSVVKYYL